MKVEVVTLGQAPELEEAFVRLNRAWIERLFVMEPSDHAVLARPGRIVADGGEVLFARTEAGVAVGTGALLHLDDETVEVVKMAVDEAVQGQGIGRLLLDALLGRAAELGYGWVRIETSSRLVAANALYRRGGFVPARDQVTRHGFARADVFLEKRIGPNAVELGK